MRFLRFIFLVPVLCIAVTPTSILLTGKLDGFGLWRITWNDLWK